MYKLNNPEQCNLTGDKDHPVALKTLKQIPSDSLQNPSDPDASYSGHKGQSYQVQGNCVQGLENDSKRGSLGSLKVLGMLFSFVKEQFSALGAFKPDHRGL